MPSQKDITLRSGDASPKDVVLYELPIADVTAVTIYLTEFDATPNNVVLRDPTVQPQAVGPATITGTLAATDGPDTAAFVGDVSAVTAAPVVGGGIGHGGKKKRVYVKRGDQILIFKDDEAASNWVEQEREAEKERQRSEKKPYRPRKVIKLTVKTDPESIIKLPVLERLALSYGQEQNYISMLRDSDYESLARIYERLIQREEEEVLAILLVA